jgi:hypothetical protein
MTKNEALRLAVDALSDADYELGDEAIAWIKVALEMPEEKYIYGTPLLDAMTQDYVPPQRTWVGLTDQEIGQVFKEKCTEYRHWLDERAFRIACRWAEEKLKERNI